VLGLTSIVTTDPNQSLIYGVHDLWAERGYRPPINITLSRYINCGFYLIRNNAQGKALMKVARALLVQHFKASILTDQDAVNMALHLQPSALFHLPGYFNCFHGWCYDNVIPRQAIHHRKTGFNLYMLRNEYAAKCLPKTGFTRS
jgi:hypothetical protein